MSVPEYTDETHVWPGGYAEGLVPRVEARDQLFERLRSQGRYWEFSTADQPGTVEP